MKKIKFTTNFNGKLSNSYFIHVAPAPAKGVGQHQLDETTFEISTEDGSHPPVQVKLIDLQRFPMHSMRDIISYASHGKPSIELCSDFITAGHHLCHEFAAYIYQRI